MTDDAIKERLDALELQNKKQIALMRGIRNQLRGDSETKKERQRLIRNYAARSSRPLGTDRIANEVGVSDATARSDMKEIAAQGEKWETTKIEGKLHLAHKKRHGMEGFTEASA